MVYYAAYGDDQFVWDPPKSQSTFDDRGLTFHAATIAFRGPMLRRRDARKDYGEPRYQALGECNGQVLAIVFTPRNNQCRIISLRLATDEEAITYYAAIRNAQG